MSSKAIKVSWPRALLQCSLGFVAFIVGCAILRSLWLSVLGPIFPPIHDYRWSAFLEEKAELNAVFVGSSRMFRHINPRVFDLEMAELGHSTRSFNLGMPSQTLAESWRLIEETLEAAPEIRYVFLEPAEIRHLKRNMLNPRLIQFFTPKNQLRAMRFELGSRHPDAMQKVAETFEPTLVNLTNKGRLARYLFPDFDRAQGAEPLPHIRGHRPLDWELEDRFLRRHKTLLGHTKNFAEAVPRKQEKRRSARRPLTPSHRDLLLSIIEDVHSRGAEILFIAPPNGLSPAWSSSALKSWEDGKLPAAFFTYNQSWSLPEILDVSLWYDPGHLMARGADLLSEELASDFAHCLDRVGKGSTTSCGNRDSLE